MNTQTPTQPPVGRFAPTPSGRMHLGNAFSALLGWLSIRAAGGRLLLRMEDLDPQRTSDAFARDIRSDLEWLGLNWDEERPNQGSRSDFYAAQVEKLRAMGLVYPCFCSRAQLHAASAPHLSDGSYVYNGCCRGLTPAQVDEKRRRRGGALRVRVPSEVVALADGLQGPYRENLACDCGDFILRRSDGVYAYQLAAPADDGDSGVTEVVRGRDLLPSTPRQIWLMRTLGYTPPAYVHLPLLMAADGHRLSKREHDIDLGVLRAALPGPEPLVGYMARLAGLHPAGTPLKAADLLPGFNWARVHKEDLVAGDIS